MGLSSFPSSVSEGVLPILIINTAMSFTIVKDILIYILQIVGLKSNTEPEFIDPLWSHPSENTPATNSGQAQVQVIAEEIRQSLPITQFKSFCDGSVMGNGNTVECSVCLSKFEDGDETRELPCCHFFHMTCLDKWLEHQQTTCPLCRSSLVPEDRAMSNRSREQELSDDFIFWCSSYNESGYHGMWTER
eukprot:Gb_30879 [translate_table: standard]